MTQRALGRQLTAALAWGEAHVTFEQAIEHLPQHLRGTRPPGAAHSPWQLAEHLRFTQHDILEFCRNPNYAAPAWPADYWPTSPEPPSAVAWDECVRGYRDDRHALQELFGDESLDLMARIPHGDGQTYVRELLLLIDHASYHVGQLVAVRRALGAWPTA